MFEEDYRARGRRWGGAVSLPSLPSGSLVLECGCGNGKSLAAMGAWHAVGIDISPSAVRLAPGSLLGDVRALPFSDAVFDAVFCRHVLGHLLLSDRFLGAAEMFRVLKPSGRVFFTGFSRGDFRYGKGELVEPHTFLRGDGIFTHYFDAASLREVFGEGEIYVTSWTMHVRGTAYPREEIHGVFRT